jgi:hypothetical protein
LSLGAAVAAAADPVVRIVAAGVVIAQQRPIGAILIGIANLTCVRRVDHARKHRLARDHATALTALADFIAALTLRAALAPTAVPTIGQPAGGVGRYGRPVFTISTGVADFACIERILLSRIECPIPNLALAFPARCVSAAKPVRAALTGAADRAIAAGSAIVRGRPIIRVGVGLADFARFGGIDRPFADILAVYPAVRAAFLTTGRAAALSG